MHRDRHFRPWRLAWIIPIGLILLISAAFLAYASVYYRADRQALDSLAPYGRVDVRRTDYGWFFDGPSDARALIFYPGAKVEETAYAPLLRGLAEAGMDACLVRMPLRFAFLGVNRADAVMRAHGHAHWFVGGHSLGGAMAAEYAARNADRLEGVILLGAYTETRLDDRLLELVIYGTEDGIATAGDIERGRRAASAGYVERAIPGGNHAGFGNYGIQSGDGAAAISPEAQQAEAIRIIMEAADRTGENESSG